MFGFMNWWVPPSTMVLCALLSVGTVGFAQTPQADSVAASGTAAQTVAPSAAEAEPAIGVAIAGFTLVPALAEDGTPALDDEGNPIINRIPLSESLVTPGDAVLYVITLTNPTADAATDLQVGAHVAAEVLLDPYSITGPEGMGLEWSDSETPEIFRPVFEMVEGEIRMQADLETIRNLRLTLPELAPEASLQIEYTVTLR
jgi:uncharacterized repeat protein (TIGR01451 family)